MATIPFGFCHCGCGNRTSIAKQTRKNLGHIAGQPVRYLAGHNPTKQWIDILGEVSGRLTALRFVGVSEHGDALWLCRCDGSCGGKEVVVKTGDFRSGNTKSCGCLSSDLTKARNFKHGYAKRGQVSVEHNVWRGMIDRCTNPASKAYRFYGAKGVKVCDRWLGEHGFENFLKDVGPRPKATGKGRRAGKELDRFPNNTGNYEPGNVRWTDQLTNIRNRRGMKLTVEKVARIRKLAASGMQRNIIAQKFDVTLNHIHLILRSKTVWS